MVRLADAALQQRRTLVLQFLWLVDGRCAQNLAILSGGYCIHMRSVPSYDSDDISPIACRSQGVVSLPRHYKGTLALDLRPLIVSVDDVGSA